MSLFVIMEKIFERDDKVSSQFRKSVFGFNTDDVKDYITKMHKEHSDQIAALTAKIDALSADLKTAETCLGQMVAEKADLESQLKVYSEKSAEIENRA